MTIGIVSSPFFIAFFIEVQLIAAQAALIDSTPNGLLDKPFYHLALPGLVQLTASSAAK
jgi:hypothetical protein